MRILLDYRPALRNRTGVGEYAHQMAAALARRTGTGDQLTLFSSSWKDRLEPSIVPGASIVDRRIPVSVLNFAWHQLGWPSVQTLGAHPDVAWSMHPLLVPAADAATVVTIHDLYFLDHPDATVREIRRDYAALAKDHAHRADGLIAVSEYTADRVAERLNVPRERIAVCPNGAPRWDPRTEPDAPGPILHVGTVEPRKNIAALIKSYANLVKEKPDSPPLVLAGRVEPHAMLSFDEDTAVVRDRVQYLGYVTDDQRLRLYREASMLVLASEDEGFGLPVLEAMTLGVPVVATARGAIPEVAGDAVVLIREKDPLHLPEAFADGMRQILCDADLRRGLRKRGIARSKLFDWDESAARAHEALSAAVARRRSHF